MKKFRIRYNPYYKWYSIQVRTMIFFWTTLQKPLDVNHPQYWTDAIYISYEDAENAYYEYEQKNRMDKDLVVEELR